MERGRLLIIIGIILGLATLLAVSFLVSSTIVEDRAAQEVDPPIGYRVVEFSSNEYDCWVIESNTDHYDTVTGGCERR